MGGLLSSAISESDALFLTIAPVLILYAGGPGKGVGVGCKKHWEVESDSVVMGGRV